MKTITHVAVIYKGIEYSLPRPYRHHHILGAISSLNKVSADGNQLEGFLDNEGKYHHRKEAFKIARDANQLNSRPVNDILYSENLWEGRAPVEDVEELATMVVLNKSDLSMRYIKMACRNPNFCALCQKPVESRTIDDSHDFLRHDYS